MQAVPGITNRYCGPSFETATEPVIGRAFARPVGDLLRMRSNSLKHNNLMLRSERRERLEAWAASDSPISHNQYLWTGPCFFVICKSNRVARMRARWQAPRRSNPVCTSCPWIASLTLAMTIPKSFHQVSGNWLGYVCEPQEYKSVQRRTLT